MYKNEIDKMAVVANSYEEGLKKAKEWAASRDVTITIVEE